MKERARRGTVIIQTCTVSIKNQMQNHNYTVEEAIHVLVGTGPV